MIEKNCCEADMHSYACCDSRPLEVYLFFDPLCSDCYAMNPILKKLQIEYGHYFRLKYVLCGKLKSLNTVKRNVTLKRTMVHPRYVDCSQPGLKQIKVSSPYTASIAVKAAELQGKKAGIRFLKKLQEYFYLREKDITSLNVLINCAREASLDVDEFLKDLYSKSTFYAFQCDLKITKEMEVTETPTLVFFNNNVEEAGIKLAGVNPYEIYVDVLTEVLGEFPVSHSLPPLASFIRYHNIVSTEDLAFIYDRPHFNIELELKKLALQQIVKRIETTKGTFWKYNQNTTDSPGI